MNVTSSRQTGNQYYWGPRSMWIGLMMIVAGAVLRPAFVAGHLRPDGIFGGGIVDRLTIGRIFHWGVLSFGAMLLTFGILKRSGSDIAGRIERGAESFGLSNWSRSPAVITMIFSFLALPLLNKSANLVLDDKAWKPVIGYEYYWIGESLAEGRGFSLTANHHWYFYDFVSEYPSDQYYPTALEEPIYPLLLAFAHKALGEYGHLAVLLLHLVALYGTGLFIYLLGRKVFDSRLGILASIALLTTWWYQVSWLTIGAFSPAILGGFLTTLSAYFLFWSLERISVRRSAILGLTMAVCCLTLAAGMIIVPLAALLTLLWERPARPFAWKPALAIVVVYGAVLAPWTLRNYLVFGQFIPIRTGFGLAMHQSNPALAATFSNGPHTCVEELGPIWRAANAKEAIRQVRRSQEKRFAMYKRSYDCIALEAPGGYSSMNEAQRDKVYLAKSIDFIVSNPKTFLELTNHRIQAFLVGWSPQHTKVTLLAFLGGLLAIRNRKVLVLGILVAAYVFPFSLTTSLMYRYRYPIEPILFVLSCGIPIVAWSKLMPFISGMRAPERSPKT